jgi:hypothetical protein
METYTELQILDLAWNKFTGSISFITKLGGLYHLTPCSVGWWLMAGAGLF